MEIIITIIITWLVVTIIQGFGFRQALRQKKMDYIADVLALEYEARDLTNEQNYIEMRKQLQRELFKILKQYEQEIGKPFYMAKEFEGEDVLACLVPLDKIIIDTEIILKIIRITGHELRITNKLTGKEVIIA